MKKLFLATLILFLAVLPVAAQGGDTPTTMVSPVQVTAGPCDVPPDQLPIECLPSFTIDWVSPIPSATYEIAATAPPSSPPAEGGQAAAPPTSTPTMTPTVVMNWPVHCYIYVEVLNRALEPHLLEIWDAAHGIAQQVGEAGETTQIRIRLDRWAALIESTFEPAELTPESLAGRLAYELEITIEAADLMLYRFSCFSGYEVSRQEALDYLWANLSDWQGEFRLQ